MRTLVLGLGNPILTDDGVGMRVARTLSEYLERLPKSPKTSKVSVAEAGVGGLRLLEILSGYERVILVDAIQTKNGQAGQIYRLTPDAFCATLHSGCSHDIDLFTALKLGQKLKMPMPKQIIIIAIEVEDVTTFGEKCTPLVEAAIPQAVEAVLNELDL